jgi:hypothetical protein
LFLGHKKSGISSSASGAKDFKPVRGLMLSLEQSSLEESAMMLQQLLSS